MNVKRLKEAIDRLEDETEIIVWDAATEENRETYELTVETDMRSGAIVLVICAAEKEAGNLRDYEMHPGFEDVNSWIFEGMKK